MTIESESAYSCFTFGGDVILEHKEIHLIGVLAISTRQDGYLETSFQGIFHEVQRTIYYMYIWTSTWSYKMKTYLKKIVEKASIKIDPQSIIG